MLTEREKQWLIRLARFLEENEEYDFQEKRDSLGCQRLALSFPYAVKHKNYLDKDRKNFDYRLNAIFNRKLRNAIYLIAFVEKTFKGRGLVRRVQKQVMEEMQGPGLAGRENAMGRQT